ncbi:hypothetical protein B1R27_33720 [Streptomyces sp. GKU 895]|nr:hypothetical protein B1R27_33720 [Streptomyces sp. GKU 895]
MSVDQLPGRIREFVNYLDALLARLDQGGGWCAVFWQRDPDGMQACLEGREVPPWDVVEALLQDLVTEYGPAVAAPEVERARSLHAEALAAYDARPGARDALGDRLDVMLREQRYAAERQAELGHLLATATTREAADAIRLDLAWARDDHERATARCAELRTRMADLERRTSSGQAQVVRRGQPVFRLGDESGGSGQAGAGGARTSGGAAQAGRQSGRDAYGGSAYGGGAGAGAPSVPQQRDARTGAEAGGAGWPGGGEAVGGASASGGVGAGQGWYGHGHAPADGSPGSWEEPAGQARQGLGDPVTVSTDVPEGPEGPGGPRDPGVPSGQVTDPAPTPQAAQAPPRQCAVRRDGREDAAAVVVPPRPSRRRPPRPRPVGAPRGARFAGAGAAAEAPEPQAERLDDGDRREVVQAVEQLVRLRREGRSGEAHALLVDAAYWPAARFPLLAAELQHAGLGADWATLLWEAASLPAERLVAAADALVEAGRGADGEQVLRQGVVRPAEEVGHAVLGLVHEGRRREVRALLDAYVRVRTPEEAARSAAPGPQTLVPLLLEAAQGVSEERHWDLVHALRVAGHTG